MPHQNIIIMCPMLQITGLYEFIQADYKQWECIKCSD